MMPISVTDTILIIAVTAAATFITRLFPFALFGRSKEGPPAIVKYLGNILPPTVIAILIVYCMRSTELSDIGTFVPQLISIVLVVLLHVWKRNNLLSIGCGTLCYMLLIQFVFV